MDRSRLRSAGEWLVHVRRGASLLLACPCAALSPVAPPGSQAPPSLASVFNIFFCFFSRTYFSVCSEKFFFRQTEKPVDEGIPTGDRPIEIDGLARGPDQ